MKSKKVSFYRWEHKVSKIGPYNHDKSSVLSGNLRIAARVKNLPTPWNDANGPRLGKGSNYRCGFVSEVSMNHWFSIEDQQEMLANNFRFVEYRVDTRTLIVLQYQAVATLPKRAYRILKGKQKC